MRTAIAPQNARQYAGGHLSDVDAIPTISLYHENRTQSTLLLADTDSPAPATGGLAVLSTDTETPVVTQTPVGTDLLQSLQILTELAVHTVGEHLVVLAVHNVALSVEEPGGDLVLSRVLDDGNDALEFFGGELAGAVGDLLVFVCPDSRGAGHVSKGEGVVPLVEVDIGLLAHQVAVSATDTLDLGQGVHDLLFAINLLHG